MAKISATRGGLRKGAGKPRSTSTATPGLALVAASNVTPDVIAAVATGHAAFTARLRKIAALRDAGLDPDVDLAFILAYVGECRATIYSKIARGDLARPVKRGRSSFWPLSVVDAYKKGGDHE